MWVTAGASIVIFSRKKVNGGEALFEATHEPMDMLENLTLSMGQLYGEATKTAVGFFWKSGWAFVFGYTISAMIQALVPKQQLEGSKSSAGYTGATAFK